jgi:hypothetical protein
MTSMQKTDGGHGSELVQSLSQQRVVRFDILRIPICWHFGPRYRRDWPVEMWGTRFESSVRPKRAGFVTRRAWRSFT